MRMNLAPRIILALGWYLRIFKENKMKEIYEQLESAGYDFALAFATQSEIEAGAACGQLAIIS